MLRQRWILAHLNHLMMAQNVWLFPTNGELWSMMVDSALNIGRQPTQNGQCCFLLDNRWWIVVNDGCSIQLLTTLQPRHSPVLFLSNDENMDLPLPMTIIKGSWGETSASRPLSQYSASQLASQVASRNWPLLFIIDHYCKQLLIFLSNYWSLLSQYWFFNGAHGSIMINIADKNHDWDLLSILNHYYHIPTSKLSCWVST